MVSRSIVERGLYRPPEPAAGPVRIVPRLEDPRARRVLLRCAACAACAAPRGPARRRCSRIATAWTRRRRRGPDRGRRWPPTAARVFVATRDGARARPAARGRARPPGQVDGPRRASLAPGRRPPGRCASRTAPSGRMDPAHRLRALEGASPASPAPCPPVVDRDARRWSPATASPSSTPPRAARVWSAPARPAATAPRAVSGRCSWSGEADGTLRAPRRSPPAASLLDLRDRRRAAGGARASTTPAARPGRAPPTARFLALDARRRATRAGRWKARRRRPARRRPSSERLVLFATHEDVLYALDRGNGHLAWRARAALAPAVGPARSSATRSSSPATARGPARPSSSASTRAPASGRATSRRPPRSRRRRSPPAAPCVALRDGPSLRCSSGDAPEPAPTVAAPHP